MTEHAIAGRRSLFAGAGIAAGALAYSAMPAHAEGRPDGKHGKHPGKGCGNQKGSETLDPPLEERVLNSTAMEGGKWRPNGTVRRFEGLTFVSTVEDGEFKDAMIEIRRRMLDRPLGALYGLLPPDSYHVTIVQNGPVDSSRDPAKWPTSISTETSIADAAYQFTSMLAEADLPELGKIRLTPFEIGKQSKTSGLGVGFRVDDIDRPRLEEFELEIGRVLGLAAPRNNDYRWHSTIAYKLYQPTDEEVLELDAWRAEFFDLLPEELILREHEFNIFDNMAGFAALRRFL